MKILKSLRILLGIFLLLNIFILGCGKKKAAEPASEGPSITVEEDARLTALLSTIDTSDLTGYTPDSIPSSIFAVIKSRIDSRTDFFTNCYDCSTSPCKSKYKKYLTPTAPNQLEKIMSQLGFTGVYVEDSFYNAKGYYFYANRTGTLTFNYDSLLPADSSQTMAYNSVTAHTIFSLANFSEDMTLSVAMSSLTATGTYHITSTTLSDGLTQQNMLSWEGDSDINRIILPSSMFKVLIIENKDILMTYPFVKDGLEPKPTGITFPSVGTLPTDVSTASAKLIGQWNYLNVGNIEFKSDNTWAYSTKTLNELGVPGFAVAESGTWRIKEVGGRLYLSLLYQKTRVYSELANGTSEIKTYTFPRLVIVEFYVDDNFFAMNIYRKTSGASNTLTGTWIHDNYDYMPNYWYFSSYPVTLTADEMATYQNQINAKNIEDKALFENAYNQGEPRRKKIVKGNLRKSYVQPKLKEDKLPIFNKMLP